MKELKVEELEARIAPDLTMTITPPAGEAGTIQVPVNLPLAAGHANGANGVEAASVARPRWRRRVSRAQGGRAVGSLGAPSPSPGRF